MISAPNSNLMLGDCLQRMTEIPTGSVDAIITDPPYGMNYQSNMRTDKSKLLPKIANDTRPFIWWLPQAYRVLSSDAALYCFCDWRNSEAFRFAIELAGFQVKSQGIWDRQAHGMGDLKAQLGPQHDVIWFATKGKFKFPGKRPKSMFRSTRINGSNLVHPNEKPVDLMEQLIVSVTSPGQTVCDPFAGSGSTGVAAMRTGRSFVGIEQDETYFTSANMRIKAAQQGQPVVLNCAA